MNYEAAMRPTTDLISELLNDQLTSLMSLLSPAELDLLMRCLPSYPSLTREQLISAIALCQRTLIKQEPL